MNGLTRFYLCKLKHKKKMNPVILKRLNLFNQANDYTY